MLDQPRSTPDREDVARYVKDVSGCPRPRSRQTRLLQPARLNEGVQAASDFEKNVFDSTVREPARVPETAELCQVCYAPRGCFGIPSGGFQQLAHQGLV